MLANISNAAITKRRFFMGTSSFILISAIQADFLLLLAPLKRHEMFRTFAQSPWKRNALPVNCRESSGERGSYGRLRTYTGVRGPAVNFESRDIFVRHIEVRMSTP